MNDEDDGDELLKEIWATREAFAAAHNYDIHAMFATLREREIASGRTVIPVPPNPIASPNNPVAEVAPSSTSR